jgi:hypothetical protein
MQGPAARDLHSRLWVPQNSSPSSHLLM